MRKNSSQRGAAAIEFTLSTMFLVPLLLGTLVFGFRLIRRIEMDQITRDLGHMYVQGVDFTNAGPVQNAQTLASGFDLTAMGSSDVLLSKIKTIQQSDCDAANPTHPGVQCTNYNKQVFMEQLTIGNSSAGSSRFGTPPMTGNTVSITDQANNPAAVAANFMNVPAGVIAYMAEMNNQTPDLNIPGFSGMPLVYSSAIF